MEIDCNKALRFMSAFQIEFNLGIHPKNLALDGESVGSRASFINYISIIPQDK